VRPNAKENGQIRQSNTARTVGNVGNHPPSRIWLPASSENAYHPCQFRVHLGNPGENRSDTFGTVDTVANPDYVTAEASRDRLALANQAGSLGLALDAADTIQAQDSLEKMLVHQMAVLHRGVMRATARLDEELDAAGVIDANKREAANVRACRLAGAISRMSATYQQGLLTLQRKRTGGNQHVTVKHIHQQVNVTEGGQAVVAGLSFLSWIGFNHAGAMLV